MKKIKKRDVNQISRGANITIATFFGIFSLMCTVPFLIIMMSSITDEATLMINGYSLFPEKISFEAYRYLFKAGDQIIRSFGVSVYVTVVGTVISVTMTALYAYALSRSNFRFRKFFMYLAFFTMLFGGGLVPTYLVVTKLVGLRDSLGALIWPMSLNVFYIIVMKTFFKTSVPESIIEAAQIDGAGEFRTFLKIVLPISLPSIATITLFTTLGYWNDWFNALLYIDSPQYVPIQYLMMQIENNIEFLLQNSGQMGTGIGQASTQLPGESVRMAIVVLSTLPIACAYPFFQKYFVQGLTVGAIKE